MKRDVVIVGAGPGGLRCAELLARGGVKVLVLEKNTTIGKKVCAGGITWSGLIGRVPEELLERSFCRQILSTRRQHVELSSQHPIIATVNREKLGGHMASRARQAGAELILGARVTQIGAESVTFVTGNKNYSVRFARLVGADGSLSRVRQFLGQQSRLYGIGINYYLPASRQEMIWHFDSSRFGSGYAWVFPHSDRVSVGAYIPSTGFKAALLGRNLADWLRERQNLTVAGERARAEKISYDYRGWDFGRIFLLGDAAGLASPLTGEGIYPAIVSAESIAGTILDNTYVPEKMNKLLVKHRKHLAMTRLSGRSPVLASILSEVSAFLLRSRILTFETFEMG